MILFPAVPHLVHVGAWAMIAHLLALLVGLLPLGVTGGDEVPWAPMLVNSGQPTWRAQPDDYVTYLTSAAGINLPDVGYRLVRVQVETGTTPGSFQITPDGISQCHFPSGSNGTTGAMSWALLWAFRGTQLSSSLFTFNGGVSRATLTFSKGASMGPPLLAYRAIRFTITTSATHASPTAFTAVNYSVSPAVPVGVIVFATTVGYTFLWPQIGTAQGGAPADSMPGQGNTHTAPSGIPKATSLTPLYENTVAAGTEDCYVGYRAIT